MKCVWCCNGAGDSVCVMHYVDACKREMCIDAYIHPSRTMTYHRLYDAMMWHCVGRKTPTCEQIHAYARENDDTVAWCMLAIHSVHQLWVDQPLGEIVSEAVRTAHDANRPVRRFARALAEELYEAGLVTKIVT